MPHWEAVKFIISASVEIDMEQEPARRFSDELLWRLDQTMKDHITRFERFEKDMLDRWDKHLSWAEAEKTSLTTRVNVIESVWRSIEKPVKMVGWAVTIFFAVLVTSFAAHIVDWFKKHWGQ